jgi:hypothetical protein
MHDVLHSVQIPTIRKKITRQVEVPYTRKVLVRDSALIVVNDDDALLMFMYDGNGDDSLC